MNMTARLSREQLLNDPVALKAALKELIVQACNRDTPPAAIGDTDSLIGSDSQLGLDSLDVLQVNVALANHFGVRVEDSKHARRVMQSIDTLAAFIRSNAK